MADSTTHVALLTGQTEGLLEKIDALVDALSPALTFGRRDYACVGLTFAIYGGKMLIAGVSTMIANQAFDVSAYASGNCYVYVNSDGTFTLSASSPDDSPPGAPASSELLYTLVVGTDSVTSYTDHRPRNGVILAAVLSLLGIDSFEVTGSGPYQVTISKGAYSGVIDLI